MSHAEASSSETRRARPTHERVGAIVEIVPERWWSTTSRVDDQPIEIEQQVELLLGHAQAEQGHVYGRLVVNLDGSARDFDRRLVAPGPSRPPCDPAGPMGPLVLEDHISRQLLPRLVVGVDDSFGTKIRASHYHRVFGFRGRHAARAVQSIHQLRARSVVAAAVTNRFIVLHEYFVFASVRLAPFRHHFGEKALEYSMHTVLVPGGCARAREADAHRRDDQVRARRASNTRSMS